MAFILIVDYDTDSADTLFEYLKLDGHEISIAVDTETALKQINRKQPDLLLLDVMGPEDRAKSFDLARILRRQENHRDFPIMMLTGINDDYPFKFTAQDLDSEWFPVSDFLEKPLDAPLLRKKITALLETRDPKTVD